MSPSTSLFMDIVANSRDLKIGTLQTEDEIASICMAIGASYGGARSMVTTSGGGFALMTEAVGLAAMAETPVVIYNAQRPGPSTGLPTRTEQADLFTMAFASQGEFPRILLPGVDHGQPVKILFRDLEAGVIHLQGIAKPLLQELIEGHPGEHLYQVTCHVD